MLNCDYSSEKTSEKEQKSSLGFPQKIKSLLDESARSLELSIAANNQLSEAIIHSCSSLEFLVNDCVKEMRELNEMLINNKGKFGYASAHNSSPGVFLSNEEVLLGYLYGGTRSFTHQLVLNNILDQPFYRERNFK